MFGTERARAGLAVLLLCAALVVGSPASGATARCAGRVATIVGADSTGPIEGTAGDDVIVGRRGSDEIRSFGGNDVVCGKGGDDFIEAGGGRDIVKGGRDLDTLDGGADADRLFGQGNSDSLKGGPGDDRMFGGAGSQDSLIGDGGDDLIDGGRGHDLAEFWTSNRGVRVSLMTQTARGQGRDDLSSIEGVVGTNFDDVLTGSRRSNFMVGQMGDDEIHALGSGRDRNAPDFLVSGGGEDLLDGGPGPDTVSYNLSPLPVTANLATGEATASSFGHDTFDGIENLTGSKEDDTLTGDDGDNLIIGNWGNDALDGGGGRDEAAFFDALYWVRADLTQGTATARSFGTVPWVDTLANFEDLSGGAGGDELTGDDGPNRIWGGWGNDELTGLGDDDVLLGSRGTDEADGGDGTADRCRAESETSCEFEPFSAATLAGVRAGWSRVWAPWRPLVGPDPARVLPTGAAPM